MKHNWKDALAWHRTSDFCYTPEKLAELVSSADSDEHAIGHAKGFRAHYAITAALEAMIVKEVSSPEDDAQ